MNLISSQWTAFVQPLYWYYLCFLICLETFSTSRAYAVFGRLCNGACARKKALWLTTCDYAHKNVTEQGHPLIRELFCKGNAALLWQYAPCASQPEYLDPVVLCSLTAYDPPRTEAVFALWLTESAFIGCALTLPSQYSSWSGWSVHSWISLST